MDWYETWHFLLGSGICVIFSVGRTVSRFCWRKTFFGATHVSLKRTHESTSVLTRDLSLPWSLQHVNDVVEPDMLPNFEKSSENQITLNSSPERRYGMFAFRPTIVVSWVRSSHERLADTNQLDAVHAWIISRRNVAPSTPTLPEICSTLLRTWKFPRVEAYETGHTLAVCT